jgi:CBS domain-containing membrane protein
VFRSAAARWFASFLPSAIAVRWPERVRCGIGALVGIAVTGLSMRIGLGSGSPIPFLIAPMGASAVLLFAVPASPLAQPWSIIGGNLVSAIVGVACAREIADPVAAAALAVGLAICVMFALRCVHPPSGAVALTAVLGGPAIHALGFRFVLEPVEAQSFVLLGSALAYHALTRHRYPHVARPAQPSRQGVTQADVEAALRRRGEWLDVAPDDLASLVREVELRAYARSIHELTCADIMSSPVLSVSPDTEAPGVLRVLERHRIKAVPVVDAQRQVVGIVTRTDLARTPRVAGTTGLAAWLRRGRSRPATAAPAVGDLMQARVRTVDAAMPVVELLPLFAEDGHHHIPVLDAGDRVAGMITPADLIAGLHRVTSSGLKQAA